MNPDSERNNQIRSRRRADAHGRTEHLPPLLVAGYLGMLAIAVMFAVLVAAYVQARFNSGVPTGLYALPRFFSLSTIVLLISSYTMAQAPRLYALDDLPGLGRCLVATLLLGCVFAGLQLLGWRELLQNGVAFRGVGSRSSGQFLYLISALHVAHLLGGMLLLLVVLLGVRRARRDAVRALVFIRNPYYRRLLRLLGSYWHFIDALWVVLFGVFLFMY